MIEYFMNKHNNKVTVLQVQKLAGFLSFLCSAITPGRAFVRRLYGLTLAERKLIQHHRVRITEDVRMDLAVCGIFLNNPKAFCRQLMAMKKKNCQGYRYVF